MRCNRCKRERLDVENFEAAKLLLTMGETAGADYCECPGSLRPPPARPNHRYQLGRLELERRPKLLSESRQLPPERKVSEPTLVTASDVARKAHWSGTHTDLVGKLIQQSLTAKSKRMPNSVQVIGSAPAVRCHACESLFNPYATAIGSERCVCFFLSVETWAQTQAAVSELDEQLSELAIQASRATSMLVEYELAIKLRGHRVTSMQAAVVVAESLALPITWVLDDAFADRARSLIAMLSAGGEL